ncbi:hypothetical protein BH23BAC1_BH23BAC1_13630 [soil metagenome]
MKELKAGVRENEQKKEKLHQVFEPSFDAKVCDSTQLIEQKLDYMHHNPVKGNWSLVSDFTQYPHSSAAYYEMGEEGSFFQFYIIKIYNITYFTTEQIENSSKSLTALSLD